MALEPRRALPNEFVFRLEISEGDSKKPQLKIVSPPSFDPSSTMALESFSFRLVHGENTVLYFAVNNPRILERPAIMIDLVFLQANSEYQKYAAPDEFYALLRKNILMDKNIPCLPRLEETRICIRPGTIIDPTFSKFLNSLANPNKIKNVALYKFLDDLPLTFEALGRLTKLENLWLWGNEDPNFGRCQCHSKDAIQNLAKSLQGMLKLREVHIANWCFFEDPDECLGLLVCSAVYLKKKNKDMQLLIHPTGRQFIGDAKNNDHFRNLDKFSERTVDVFYYRSFFTLGPPFGLAKDTAQLLGIIPENGKRNGISHKSWVQAMKAMKCRKEDRAKHFHFFFSQMEPNKDICHSLLQYSSAVLIQKNVRRYLAHRHMSHRVLDEQAKVLREQAELQRKLAELELRQQRLRRRQALIPKPFFGS